MPSTKKKFEDEKTACSNGLNYTSTFFDCLFSSALECKHFCVILFADLFFLVFVFFRWYLLCRRSCQCDYEYGFCGNFLFANFILVWILLMRCNKQNQRKFKKRNKKKSIIIAGIVYFWISITRQCCECFNFGLHCCYWYFAFLCHGKFKSLKWQFYG